MRILFCYKVIDQSNALRQAKYELHKLGWTLDDKHCRNHAQCNAAITPDADVLMVHQNLVESVIDDGRPVVIFEKIDGAQLATSRNWIEHPNVKAIIKGYKLKPPKLNDICGRVFGDMLIKAGVKAKKKSMTFDDPMQKPLSDQALAKIKAGYGFGTYPHLRGYAEHPVRFDAPRRYHVHCAATVSYSGSEIETHRRLAVAAAKSYGGPSFHAFGRTVPGLRYQESMLQSYVVASPWGCGEACHRDYEAMLSGCVMVKPRTDHVDCWPDIYRANETYIPCRLDFADLHDIVKRIVKEWPAFRAMRKRNRQMVLDSRKPEAIAKRIANILDEIL